MIDYDYGVQLGPLKWVNRDLYRQARNDERIRRWCRQHTLIDERQQEAWFAAQSADPTIEMFEIVNDVEEPVGVCGLTDINHVCQRAEFSLYVMPYYQGSSFGRMALKTLVRWGFDELNLNMIWGETVGDNPAEITFEQVGFEHTGYRPAMYYKGGKWQDSQIWCLLRSTWQSLPTSL